jgi:cytosine deaminase
VQPDEVVAETLALCRDAGIAVVSLPMCNLYLQDRVPGRTPRWRGVTLLHEMAAAGILVAVSSDNCRDPFYGYGDHDVLEVFRESTRIAHLDRPYGAWPRAVTTTPADVMRLDTGRIKVGGPPTCAVPRAALQRAAVAPPGRSRRAARRTRDLDGAAALRGARSAGAAGAPPGA